MRARDRDRDREYGGPVLTPHPLSSRSGDEEYSLSVAFSPILDSLNPNIGSMVAVLGVRVFKGEPLTVVFPGDALGETTAHLLRHVAFLERLKACDILLASHHGAEADGANHADWMGALSPSVMVVSSSGQHTGHHHPRHSVLARMLELPLLDIVPHTISGWSLNSSIEEWEMERESIRGGLTYYCHKLTVNKAVLCTHTSGNVSFLVPYVEGVSFKVQMQFF
jgi:hypothetical protein